MSVAYELLDSISSMDENMVYANEEVARSLVTCGATCCQWPSQAMTGARVSFVHQNHQYFLVRDEEGQGFDACFCDS